jgi:hypothetical protein
MTSAITPVPFPSPEEEWTHRPDADEVRLTVAGITAAVTPPDGLTEVQRAVLNAHVVSMTEHPLEITSVPPLGPEEFAEGLRYRNQAFRERMVQIMLLGEMLLVPIPREVSERVETYAAWLGVGDDMIKVVRLIANGSLGLALIDFERSGYFEQMLEEPPEHLHTSRALDEAWEAACSDDALYEQWAALEDCPEGSLGLGVWRFYRARGFTFPGRPESAPPNLAQHDWIHVLADYGSTVESEIEVFGLISRANDDPGAFSLLAMVLGLFETGYLYGAAKGFFEYDRGHLSRDVDRMAVRLADATYRGAMLATHLNESGRGSKATDLLATDWFAVADRQLDDLREEYGLLPRSAAAIAAGSKTPWEKGGISPFQYAHGRDAAHAEEHEYDSFGAEPA